jgi:hypothetical protein
MAGPGCAIEEALIMAPGRPLGIPLTLLGVSILCSLVSLTTLLTRPEGTGIWRTGLNVIALLLVVTSTGLLSRGSGGDA